MSTTMHISVNNVLMACRSPHHNHQPGGGAEIVDAFAEMFATKSAMAQAAICRLVPR